MWGIWDRRENTVLPCPMFRCLHPIFIYGVNFTLYVRSMAHHIWCESLVYRVKKWVTKQVLTDKMIRTIYGVIQYMLVRTACAGGGILFIVSSCGICSPYGTPYMVWVYVYVHLWERLSQKRSDRKRRDWKAKHKSNHFTLSFAPLLEKWIKIEILLALSLDYTKQNEDHTGTRHCIPGWEYSNPPRSRRLVRRNRKTKVIHCHPALGERALESYSNTWVLSAGMLWEETTWIQDSHWDVNRKWTIREKLI